MAVIYRLHTIGRKQLPVMRLKKYRIILSCLLLINCSTEKKAPSEILKYDTNELALESANCSNYAGKVIFDLTFGESEEEFEKLE